MILPLQHFGNIKMKTNKLPDSMRAESKSPHVRDTCGSRRRLYCFPMAIAASERYWRLRSSPLVETQHQDFLCELNIVLLYTWITKPFILPLQHFGNTNMKTNQWPDSMTAESKSPHLRDTGGSRRRL